MKFTVIYNDETFNKESDVDLTIKDLLDKEGFVKEFDEELYEFDM